jgi:hypothetical protein
MFLIFSAFIYRPSSVLASNSVSVFLSMECMISPSRLASEDGMSDSIPIPADSLEPPNGIFQIRVEKQLL